MADEPIKKAEGVEQPDPNEISTSHAGQAPENKTAEGKEEFPLPAGSTEKARQEIQETIVSSDREKPKEEPKEEPVKEEPSEEPQEEIPKEEEKDDIETIKERIQKNVQKRIDKVVAKSKTLEEQLAERDAEIERLRAQTESKKEDREPTDEEVKQALLKARQDGDTEFEFQIIDYMMDRRAKKEREAVLAEESQLQAAKDERVKKWNALVNDYSVDDKNSPLNLGNKDSLLYKTAKAFYEDPELAKAQGYRGPDGERRAVEDAFRELVKSGKAQIKVTPPKIDNKKIKEREKASVLSSGDESPIDESPIPVPSLKSNNEKTLDEVAARKQHLLERQRIGV